MPNQSEMSQISSCHRITAPRLMWSYLEATTRVSSFGRGKASFNYNRCKKFTSLCLCSKCLASGLCSLQLTSSASSIFGIWNKRSRQAIFSLQRWWSRCWSSLSLLFSALQMARDSALAVLKDDAKWKITIPLPVIKVPKVTSVSSATGKRTLRPRRPLFGLLMAFALTRNITPLLATEVTVLMWLGTKTRSRSTERANHSLSQSSPLTSTRTEPC